MPSIDEVLRIALRKIDHNKNAHRFGYELGNPQLPEPVGTVAKIGTASDPAHSDHIHAREDSGWILVNSGGSAPAYENGWVDFGVPWVGASFRKLDGIVYLQGIARSGTATSVIFTLPVGFRPAYDSYWITMSAGGGAQVRTYPDGRVYVGAYFAGGSNASVGLSGISFPAA